MRNYRWVSEAPVATGSFAVVYRGEMKSGEVVAIKILRPSIEQYLRSDLRTLRVAGKLFKQFLVKNIVDYEAVLEEFSRTCLLETDYSREVENMRYFQRYYAEHPYVVIPKAYSEQCGKNVIVQEWIEGETFASVLAGRNGDKAATELAYEKTGSNLWTQMVVAGGEAVRMALTADFVFGDPHPGNIKLLPNNRIAFIDFGIIANRPSSRMAFYKWVKSYRDVLNGKKSGVADLAEATIVCFCPDLALALRGCEVDGESAMDKIMDGVRDKLEVVMQNDGFAKDLMENGHLFRMFTEALDSNNALGLELDMANFQLLKAMQAYLGSMTVLDNSETGDKFSAAMLSAMNYALDYADRYGVENDMPVASRYSRDESATILVDMMSSLANGDEFLFRYLCGRV
ncbi:MAG: AarF/ABC1/UbiB kinase family protein [Candidatus Saccharimonadales bacterium]